VALLVSGTAMVFYNLQNYRSNLVEELTSQAILLGRANSPALQFDDQEAAQNYLELLIEQPKIRAAAIYNANGAIFASYLNEGISIDKIPKLPSYDGTRMIGDDILLFQRIVTNNEILGTVFLRVHYKLNEKIIVNTSIAFAVFALAMGIAILMTLWLQSTITRPILSVTYLAKKVVEHRDYSLRATKTTEDEVGYLVDAFNAMLSEVERSNLELKKSNSELIAQVRERQEAELALRKSEQQILQLNAELEQRVQERTLQLEIANKELEAFSYSVSHDLRAPLRAIDGFSQALLEDYQDHIDETGRGYLDRVRNGAQRMGILIDDLLKLSRVSRVDMNLQEVDLSKIAKEITDELADAEPDRVVHTQITSGLKAWCDPQLTRIALQNLLNNAWKYSAGCTETQIEFGMRLQDEEVVFFVQDNGVGFDMAYSGKLFEAFQRLHDAKDFAGTGIGLATVQRIISRHGGQIWAESKPSEGATFYFTFPLLDKRKQKSATGETYES